LGLEGRVGVVGLRRLGHLGSLANWGSLSLALILVKRNLGCRLLARIGLRRGYWGLRLAPAAFRCKGDGCKNVIVVGCCCLHLKKAIERFLYDRINLRCLNILVTLLFKVNERKIY
jgi:hypothetical protein